MTYIEPTPSGAPPEVDPAPLDAPEITPADAPTEAPPLQPGGGEPGDSRPYGQG